MKEIQEQIQIIKKIIEGILDKMTIEAEIDILEEEENIPRFVIRTQQAGILIGENGQCLFALNHLLKKIAENEFLKRNTQRIQFSLDINDYRVKKNEELRTLARMNAQRVRYFKKEVELEPMTAYERRIIHSTLSEYPDITTESVGEGDYRHVVIKPLDTAEK